MILDEVAGLFITTEIKKSRSKYDDKMKQLPGGAQFWIKVGSASDDMILD